MTELKLVEPVVNGAIHTVEDTIDAAPPEERPVFDFEELSWGDSKRAAYLSDKVTKANDPDEAQGYLNEMQAMLSHLIISVPRSWLVRRAPADIDWTDPASLDYVKNIKMGTLMKMLTDAKAPESVTKNSEAH